MQTALQYQTHLPNTGKDLIVCDEVAKLLGEVRATPNVPANISLKKISTDMVFAALSSCDAIGNDQLYLKVMHTHDQLGFENLSVYYGIILGKSADLDTLHDPDYPTSVPFRGKMIPKGYLIYGYLLAKALHARPSLVSNLHTQMLAKNYLVRVMAHLAYNIISN